ncbi:unnamed protein product [Urochloa decumbens]|uniref:Uncharacterized protein n=1 Tax=Urochloa decumbens TaxID=240449 RepID=A0ABC9B3U9_9POAL
MELATAALSSLLPKLGSLLSDEYKLQKGLRGEIRFLQAEMESMQAALEGVSNMPSDQIRGHHKIWARDLKELIYDIEDSVDAFMVRVDAPVCSKPHSFRRFFGKTIGLLTKVKNRHHIADDIQDIKSRIKEVTSRRERYKFDDAAAQPENTAMDPRLPALYEEAKNLVGIDSPTEKLTALLMDGKGVQKQQLMVVSIVGIGGLGKTTLANSVYQRLKGGFQCHAFVSISLKPDIKKIFCSMLRQVSQKEYHNAEAWNHTELIDEIRHFLDKNRYIIVIDDLWEHLAWTNIKCALPDNNIGSRVLVTTRNVDVAKLSCSPINDTMYELDPLSYENSKRLFCKRVFHEDEEIHSELEEVTHKTLTKCGGVPLAIITTASLLASKPNKTKYEWYRVYKSMGSGLENDKTMKNMREILYLSYGHLPSYLKPCLLYLSMFPEDHLIQRYTLLETWVAEGFVDEKHGNDLYDLGNSYFDELVNRSMILPVNFNGSGIATGCRVHDMILDLIISLSARENFAITFSEGSKLISPVCKVRRLSLQGSKVDSHNEESKEEEVIITTSTMAMFHVRSLIAFGEISQWMPPLAKFSVLRVLDLEQFPCKNMHAKDLGNLHHLRFLKLGGELDIELLEEIGNLKLLKTLYLRNASIKELPASICRLAKLEYLEVPTGVNFLDGIGNLMSLRQLGWLNVKQSPSPLALLGNLIKLRVLGIYGLGANDSYGEKFLMGLSKLSNLRGLAFEGEGMCSLDCMRDQWRGPVHLQRFYGNRLIFSQVPLWFFSLSELSCLSIKVNMLRQDDLQLLGALPVLRSLKLQVIPSGITDERLVVDADQPFRSLAEFEFDHYTRCCLVFAHGVMPKLQRIKLYFRVRKREGGGFDTGLENLPSLKEVTVRVNCEGAQLREVENVETMVRDAIDMHLNRPTLVLSREAEDKMVTDEDKDDGEVCKES